MGMVIGFTLLIVATVSLIVSILSLVASAKKAKQRGVFDKFELHTAVYTIPVWLVVFYFPTGDYSAPNNLDSLLIVWSVKTACMILAPAIVARLALSVRSRIGKPRHIEL